MTEPNSDLKPVEIQELPQVSAGHGGGCACGHEDDGALPELDATVIPHAIRHATIFGALDSIKPGFGMILVAPHDPKPLLAQSSSAARAPSTSTTCSRARRSGSCASCASRTAESRPPRLRDPARPGLLWSSQVPLRAVP